MDTRHIIKCIVLLPAVFAVILLNSGCKKQLYHNEVSGTVVDSITGLPLAGATVSLIEQESEFNLIPGYGDIILQVTTGSDGKFFFEYKAKRRHGYNYTVYKEGYATRSFPLVERKFFGKEIKCNLFMLPYPYLGIHYKNVNPFNQNDAIIIHNYTDYIVGINVDDTTEITPVYVPNVHIRIRWSVIKDSINTLYIDSVYCPAGDTVIYDIYY